LSRFSIIDSQFPRIHAKGRWHHRETPHTRTAPQRRPIGGFCLSSRARDLRYVRLLELQLLVPLIWAETIACPRIA
jgi:hypothetical protein